ncbi:DUF6702 family protein [Algoriphagus namhaensis]|uniref:DUF6702 family protein n=1 Tax=Algoriphagus namhaensis TaxID=915353 RepID=A0ABV8AR09_9BACT
MLQNYIVLIIWGWMGWAVHPFFISLTEIRQNTESGRLEIAQKIFWDDLEVELNDLLGESVDILNPKDKTKLNKQFKDYLLAQNQLRIDGKNLPLEYLGYEIDDDAVWFYIQSEPLSPLTVLEVKNTVLLKNFSTQQNIVHVYFPGYSTPRSLLLGKGEESGLVKKE